MNSEISPLQYKYSVTMVPAVPHVEYSVQHNLPPFTEGVYTHARRPIRLRMDHPRRSHKLSLDRIDRIEPNIHHGAYFKRLDNGRRERRTGCVGFASPECYRGRRISRLPESPSGSTLRCLIDLRYTHIQYPCFVQLTLGRG